jgi:thiamine-monophosphate kinase
VNLSDLAAKGADPAGFLLSLALPRNVGDDWLERFGRGLAADAEAFGCPLFGGDTVRSPGPIMISITAFGLVPSGRMVRRGGAKVGDVVMVTGAIGDAVLGLKVQQDETLRARLDPAAVEHVLGRYRLPQPRIGLAVALRDHANAAMDVSDGLAGDLAKLCRGPGVSAEIDVGSIPFSAPVRAALAQDPALLSAVLSGGDDYEILFTLPEPRVASLREAAAAANVPVALVGRIVAGDAPPRFVGADGKALQFSRTSFSHF